MATKAQLEKQLTEDLLRQKKQIARRDRHKKRSPIRRDAKARLLRIKGRLAVTRAAIARKQTPQDKAVAWFMSQQGVSEKPDGSNWGHPVQDFIQYTGYSSPVPWCGCGACVAVVKYGKAKIPTRIHIGYTGNIEADARANRNGLKAVPIKKAKKGDLVTFAFSHIAVLREDWDPRNPNVIKTIEANTSPLTSGSQADGGTIAAKTRNVSDVVVVARPNYPKG